MSFYLLSFFNIVNLGFFFKISFIVFFNKVNLGFFLKLVLLSFLMSIESPQ
jgi:hypothetical protein